MSDLRASTLDGSGKAQISDVTPWWKKRTPIDIELRHFEVPDGLGATETIKG